VQQLKAWSGYQRRTLTPEISLLGNPQNAYIGNRRVVHSSDIAQVEDSVVAGNDHPPCGFERAYQIAITYYGLFAYRVGRKRWTLDANRILFVSPGWEFTDEQPILGLGHACILINPALGILEEVCGAPGPMRSSAFIQTSRPSTMRLRLLVQLFRNFCQADIDLAKDEWVIRMIQEAISGPAGGQRRSSSAVDRAKEILHDRSCERLTLDEIAKEVGLSPVYLTQEFTRSEGTPLYRYQLRLRLSRALTELPHCEDITRLALDLGFSSHSLFGAAFRSAFGMTPSAYRAAASSAKRANLVGFLHQ
jgi:AraC-like DNA-binding protein